MKYWAEMAYKDNEYFWLSFTFMYYSYVHILFMA